MVAREVGAHVMNTSTARWNTRLVVLGILISVCAGCLGLSAENKRLLGTSNSAAVNGETTESSIRPAAVKASAPPQSEAQTDSAERLDSKDQPIRRILSEEEKAKHLAVELARANADVRKVKVCHDKKNDEWWLVLYEDAGEHFRLRQYTWSIAQDQPEEFLIIKRISRNKLESHLTSSEQDRVCQIVAYDSSLPVPDVASDSPAPTSRSKEVFPKERHESPAINKSILAPKPDVSQRPKEHPISNLKKSPTKEIAHSSARTNTAAIPAVSKQQSTEAAPRKAVAAPDSSAFVHAAAKGSPPEISSRKDARASGQREASINSSVEKTAPPRARITSDAGVFALAAVRPQPKPRSQSAASEASATDGAKRTVLPHAGDALTGHENLSSRIGPDGASDRGSVPSSLVFVYGSAMNHQELLSWLKANNYDSTVILEATPAVLDDHGLVWNYYSPSRGGGTVNLELKKNSRVWGLLVEVEDRGLKALDKKEGHPVYYTRGENRVRVRRVNDGNAVFAWLYRAKSNRLGKRDIWPTEEYKQKLVEAANFWQFPSEYLETLESVPTR